MRRACLIAIAACTAAAASPALAQPSPADPTAHRHLGFFLQLDAGPGYLATSTTYAGLDLKVHGTAGSFSVSAGGAVMEDLIVAGQLWGATASSPELEVNGQKLPVGGSEVTLSGVGVNVTYYVMPLNLYLSVAPMVTSLSSKQGGVSGSTDSGFGARFAVGKEWWVADHWGIGLNAQMTVASNKDSTHGSASWGTFWGGLAFSATFN